MTTIEGFAHRTKIMARFKLGILIFWVPLVSAAIVPAIITALGQAELPTISMPVDAALFAAALVLSLFVIVVLVFAVRIVLGVVLNSLRNHLYR